MTLLDLQKKAAYYCIKPSWVEPFWPPVAIIQTPNYGNLAAQKVVEELKINSPKDKAQLAIAKEIVYKEGFYSGVMIVGPHAGIPVQEAKALIRQIMIESKMALTYCEPEGVVVSRSGDDCVVTLCDQWYLDYSDEEWKKDARRYSISNHLPSPVCIVTKQSFPNLQVSRKYGMLLVRDSAWIRKDSRLASRVGVLTRVWSWIADSMGPYMAH